MFMMGFAQHARVLPSCATRYNPLVALVIRICLLFQQSKLSKRDLRRDIDNDNGHTFKIGNSRVMIIRGDERLRERIFNSPESELSLPQGYVQD
jgi:hypothetical protein